MDRTTIQISEELRKELKVLASKRDCSYEALLREMLSVFKELEPDKTIISIPKRLAERIERLVTKSDFRNLSDFVSFLLRLLLYEEEIADIREDKLNKIKQRLKQLGYIE